MDAQRTFFNMRLLDDPLQLLSYILIINGIRYVNLMVLAEKLGVKQKKREICSRALLNILDLSKEDKENYHDDHFFIKKATKHCPDLIRIDCFFKIMVYASKIPYCANR